MQFHFSVKGLCCLTRHNGLLTVETLRWILIRVAFSTQQKLVLCSKWFLHQRATAFGTVEASLMPVAAFVGQILGESMSMLMKTFLYSVLFSSAPPRNKVKNAEHFDSNSKRIQLHRAEGVSALIVSVLGYIATLSYRMLGSALAQAIEAIVLPCATSERCLYWKTNHIFLQLAFKGKQVINIFNVHRPPDKKCILCRLLNRTSCIF